MAVVSGFYVLFQCYVIVQVSVKNINYLTGALWPVSSEAIQSGRLFPVSASQQFVSRSFVSSTGDVLLSVVCPCLQGTVFVIDKYKTTLYKFSMAERQVALLGLIGLLF